MEIEEVIEAFELLETWDERFEMVSELARDLPAFPEAERHDANLVPGCTTRTWLCGRLSDDDPPRLVLLADAETPLVRGLVALLLKLYQDKTPTEVQTFDPGPMVGRLGLAEALSAKRVAGMQAFFERVRLIARREDLAAS